LCRASSAPKTPTDSPPICRGFLVNIRCIMAASQQATPQLKIMYALHMARQYRHHRNCQCGTYHGAGCTAADARWTAVLDQELDKLSAAL